MGTLTLQPDGTDGLDTVLYSDTPTTNYATNIYYIVGDPNGSTARRGLIRFSGVSTIPAGSTITSVILSLNKRATGYTSPAETSYTCRLKRCLVDWVEAQATWNVYATASDWPGSAGCSTNGTDRAAADSATATVTSTDDGAWVAWGSTAQLVADVQAWVDGTANNYGWLIQSDAENLGAPAVFYTTFHPSDYSTASYRPKLVVEYTTPASSVYLPHIMCCHTIPPFVGGY